MFFFQKPYVAIICISLATILIGSPAIPGERTVDPKDGAVSSVDHVQGPNDSSGKGKFAKGGDGVGTPRHHGDESAAKEKLPPTRELSNLYGPANPVDSRRHYGQKDAIKGKLPPTRELSNPVRPAPDTDCARHGGDNNGAKLKLPPTREFSKRSEPVKKQETVVEAMTLPPDMGIPLVLNGAVEYYVNYFSTTNKDLFERWLKNKKRYEPLVRRILREYGLPEDLIYLAMIESGFNLQAHSPMDADGPWQFIPETGKRYGLTVNHWVDERRDIQKSTVAAARYLQQLFSQFDCWYLAAAAYNAGENRIDRLIKRHDTRDFWQLRTYNTLPRETREYVPRLIAAAILSKNPEKYGLEDIGSPEPIRFVAQDVPGGVPLNEVAKAASTNLTTVKTLNPELLTDITPPGKGYRVKLPARTNTKKFRISLASILRNVRRVIGVTDHIVTEQEDVATIAKQYGVTRDDLAMVNASPLELKKGESICIPQFASLKREEKSTPVTTANAREQLRRGVYRQRPG